MQNLLTSRENETVKNACKIGQSKALRQSEKCFMAEGLKLCLDLAKTLTPLKVFYTKEALEACAEIASLDGTHYEINDSVSCKLADTKSPQGLFVIFEMPCAPHSSIKQNGRYVCLENIQDPANVGTMLRSAAAFGFDGAILSKGCADAFSPKAVRASMGAVGKIDIIQDTDMPQIVRALQEKNIAVYAAALQNAVALDEAVPQSGQGVAVAIGNEGSGLTAQCIAAADKTVRIPMMPNVESLNAAAAASVLMWHFRRTGL